MTKFNYFRCDCCSKILCNAECSKNQLMFTLIANYDTTFDLGYDDGNATSYKAHFCSQKCLLDYVTTKVKDHEDLPIVKDDDRDIQGFTKGEMLTEKEQVNKNGRE